MLFTRRCISLLLIAGMLLGAIPTSAQAILVEAMIEDYKDSPFISETPPTNSYGRSAIVDTGECGTDGGNIIWKLYENGVLELTGSGDMENYSGMSFVPWYPYRDVIEKVIMSGNISSIGDYAFDYCESLTEISIPKSVIRIGNWAFSSCKSLTDVTIPSCVESIGFFAFFDCAGITQITIPDSMITIDVMAFAWCTHLTDVTIPKNVSLLASDIFWGCTSLSTITVDKDNPYYCSVDGVLFTNDMTELLCYPAAKTELSYRIPEGVTCVASCAFQRCGNIKEILIPDTVTKIGDFAFFGCSGIERITIPSRVNSIDEHAFWECIGLKQITFCGDAPDFGENVFAEVHGTAYYPADNPTWTDDILQDYGGDLTWISKVIDEPQDDFPFMESFPDGIAIYSDHTNLSIRKDNLITLGAGVISGGELTTDVSGITFQVEDTSILDVSSTTLADNRLYVKFKGLQEGTTFVVFSDSATGYMKKVPVTVFKDNYLSYTLSSVPVQYIEKYPTNVYNANGLYIDSYTYTVNENKSATVSFDVYNTSYTYGAVEVFDQNGNLQGVVLIDKMKSSNTNVKEALWDNLGYLIRDTIDGDLLTYRQESGYSKQTPVEVTVPENGYIKISNDPQNSFVVSIINSADILMSLGSLAGEIKGYDVNSKLFAEKVTLNLVNEQMFAACVKDGSDVPQKLWKNVAKDITFSTESLGTFADTIAKNISDLELDSIITKTAVDFGCNIGEDVFAYFAGPIGLTLKGMFAMGKVENLIIQHCDLTQSANVGSIFIQNQGGGTRGSQQIVVESNTDFSEDTSLNVFHVTLDSKLLNLLEDNHPELYETISTGFSFTYNISLLKNGYEAQLDNEVTVYIPVPEELKLAALVGKAAVYRIEEDGTFTKLDYEIENDCFVFKTDHFSLYSLVGQREAVNPFEDVSEGSWYFEPVLWAVEKNITAGTAAGVFSPNTTCTRAQVVTFLWRTMGEPEPTTTENPFSDVVESSYYHKAVLWAVENNITSGTGGGKFSPNDPCTRNQVVTFLWRTMGKTAPEQQDNPFVDVVEGTYYYEPVLWAVENGITSGTSATTFAPSDPCTRAQVVTFLYRTMVNK